MVRKRMHEGLMPNRSHTLSGIFGFNGSPVQGIRLYRWVKDGLYTAI